MIDRRHGLEIPRHTRTQRFLGLQVVYQTVNARCRVQEEDVGKLDEAQEVFHVAVRSRDRAVGAEPVSCEFRVGVVGKTWMG